MVANKAVNFAIGYTATTAVGSWAAGLTTDWNEGANRFSNWSDIGKGMYQGNAWQIASRFTWELPQTFAGVTGSNSLNILTGIDEINYYHGATLVKYNNQGYFSAMTLGSYIMGHGTDFRPGSQNIMHEYGHYRQSQLIGPLYAGIVAPASGINQLFHPTNHHLFWAERWANDLGRDYFDPVYWNTDDDPLWTWRIKHWWSH
jgi:hypothetical protein